MFGQNGFWWVMIFLRINFFYNFQFIVFIQTVRQLFVDIETQS